MGSKMRRNKPSLLKPIEEVSEVSRNQDGLQDSAEPSAITSEQPPRPQCQTRQTCLKSKDSRASPASGAHKNELLSAAFPPVFEELNETLVDPYIIIDGVE